MKNETKVTLSIFVALTVFLSKRLGSSKLFFSNNATKVRQIQGYCGSNNQQVLLLSPAIYCVQHIIVYRKYCVCTYQMFIYSLVNLLLSLQITNVFTSREVTVNISCAISNATELRHVVLTKLGVFA